jgi:hypothetical protein
LAHAFGLVGVAEPEPGVLEKADRNLDGAIGARQEIAACDQLGQPVADGRADFVVVAQPIARASREQVIPLAPGTRGIDETGRP